MAVQSQNMISIRGGRNLFSPIYAFQQWHMGGIFYLSCWKDVIMDVLYPHKFRIGARLFTGDCQSQWYSASSWTHQGLVLLWRTQTGGIQAPEFACCRLLLRHSVWPGLSHQLPGPTLQLLQNDPLRPGADKNLVSTFWVLLQLALRDPRIDGGNSR